jgi:hypothetical protein
MVPAWKDGTNLVSATKHLPWVFGWLEMARSSGSGWSGLEDKCKGLQLQMGSICLTCFTAIGLDNTKISISKKFTVYLCQYFLFSYSIPGQPLSFLNPFLTCNINKPFYAARNTSRLFSIKLELQHV